MYKLYSEDQIEEWASKRADDAGRLSRQLLDTMRENYRLRNVIGNLEPLRDIDWHGKWRILSCLDALQSSTTSSTDEYKCSHDWDGPKALQDRRVKNCRKCGIAKFFDDQSSHDK